MKERKEVKMGDREGIKGAERNGRNIQSDFDLAGNEIPRRRGEMAPFLFRNHRRCSSYPWGFWASSRFARGEMGSGEPKGLIVQ